MRTVFQCVLCVLLPVVIVMAEQEKDRIGKKTVSHHEILDVNEIECFIQNDGCLGENPATGGDGFFYPAGQREKSLIYHAGLWILGKLNGALRSASVYYATEYQPGSILPDGTADDPTLEKYRVYKYNQGDAIDAEAIAQGCPETVLGDQMCFCVFNDLAGNGNVFTLPPIGIEVQMTVWAYDRPGALDETVFIWYRIVNKNRDGTPLDSAYVGFCSDPDVGGPSDDAMGCDPALNMAFAYNGRSEDAVYGDAPPALGMAFLSGPQVNSLGGQYTLPDGSVVYNRQALGLSSFTYMLDSDSNHRSRPELESANGASIAYHDLQGLRGDGQPWEDPVAGVQTPYPLSGDPLTGTGWLFKHVSPPKDVRMVIGSGPVQLKAGETHDVILAITAGQGATHLTSLVPVKEHIRQARAVHASGYDVADRLPQPELTINPAEDRLTLNWSDAALHYASAGYVLEGYNVWMAATEDGPWTHLATYDVDNGVQWLWANIFDEEQRKWVSLPVQKGADTGLRHSHTVLRDAVGDRPLAQGREYWFAVTPYVYNADGVPQVIEGLRSPVSAVPQRAPVASAARLDEITVFPNPYFGKNADERGAYEQFVTFGNLPAMDCTLRIFTLSGQLVIVLKHDNGTPFERWDLLNSDGRPVASGMHIVHIQTAYGSRVLKLGVVNRQLGVVIR